MLQPTMMAYLMQASLLKQEKRVRFSSKEIKILGLPKEEQTPKLLLQCWACTIANDSTVSVLKEAIRTFR